jgi:Kef-type K+ transport system membrane component KefB
VRLTVVLVFGLVVLANSLGLDVILGAFAAGLIVRLVIRGHAAEQFSSKVDAVGFGFLIPLFFIRSGMNLDLGALGASIGAVLRVPLFLAAFVLVRGLPAQLLYRRELGTRDRIALGLLCSTQLPLVVAITDLGVAQGQMRPATAVALVTAAVLSVLLFPTIAIWLRAESGRTASPASDSTGLEPI